MWQKRMQSDERIGLKLSAIERELILQDSMRGDSKVGPVIQHAPKGEPVMLTLGELEDLRGYVVSDSHRAADSKIQKQLGRVYTRISEVLDKHKKYSDLSDVGKRLAIALTNEVADQSTQVVSFRVTTDDRTVESARLSLKLTDKQRAALVERTRLRPKLKTRLKNAPAKTQAIEFSRAEMDHVYEQVVVAIDHVGAPHREALLAVLRKVDDVLDEAERCELRGKRGAHDLKPDLVFQFKVTLCGTSPPVWRRIQIPDGTLGDLHDCIQVAMGWSDSHLHEFDVGGLRFAPPEAIEGDFGIDAENEDDVTLSQLVEHAGKKLRFKYTYDIGDNWEHDVEFEGHPSSTKRAKFPMCVDGAMCCPPEDIGGAWGFAEFLEALANPNHERHDELTEWGGKFRADAFDAKAATKHMRRMY